MKNNQNRKSTPGSKFQGETHGDNVDLGLQIKPQGIDLTQGRSPTSYANLEENEQKTKPYLTRFSP